MANSGGLITAPVTIQDVRQVLGNSSTDLGTLCKASQINPWAKYKPVRWAHIDNTKDPLSGTSWLNSDKTWNSLATWWKYTGEVTALHRRCGFLVPSTDVGSLASVDLSAWDYEQPRGGASEPYRLTDFNQYYHGAVVPFSVDIPSRIIMDGNVTRGRVQVLVKDHPTINNNGLTFYDIFGTSMRLGIALVKGTSVWSKTASPSDSVISLEGLQNYISVGDTVKIVAFATTHNNSSWNNDDYTVYGLDAPRITFATSAEVEVVETLHTSYQIAITGLDMTDRNCLRPAGATYNSGTNRVIATNRSTQNPSKTWYITNVYCDVYKCSSDGTSQLYDSRTYTQAQTNAEPSFIAHNEGPYSQIYCDNIYPVSTLPAIDPTQYYWQIRYTFMYNR